MSDDRTSASLLDVHAHYVAPWWFEQDGTDQAQRHQLISDLPALTELDADVTRVLSAPPEILYGTAPTSDAQVRKHNEFLGETAAGRADLAAFASVDAFSEDAVGQIEHAIDDLGLSGIVIDSVHGDEYLGDKPTWAAFEAAAHRGVPVFVHPVWTPDADDLRERIGPQAAGFGRGYRNGLALLNLVNSGLVKAFPELTIVITGLAVGSLWFAHEPIARVRDDLGFSPHVYIDTTSFHAPSIRYQVDVLGADRVVLGSDWPFHTDGTREIAESTLVTAGLSESDRDLVLSGNLHALLG
ncbi:amidohydrolase family protein [Gordonia soli]|uniref:Putative hydrolase n=1 Tax=Gordonia soli NBRC 108243 TaxID=1223545 RepID=M0QLC7_9ACTN|nr:amidohydrolase family protein [Gordonia soli]GAC69229.1 putative hydrolase [Gordonia soli NBRC 108243]